MILSNRLSFLLSPYINNVSNAAYCTHFILHLLNITLYVTYKYTYPISMQYDVWRDNVDRLLTCLLFLPCMYIFCFVCLMIRY